MAQAQFLGLEGLWKKLVEGKLPARCTKQWYFETFCGVSAAEFENRGLSGLGAEVDIVSHLNGFVKPCECTPHAMHAGSLLIRPYVNAFLKPCGRNRVIHSSTLPPQTDSLIAKLLTLAHAPSVTEAHAPGWPTGVCRRCAGAYDRAARYS